MKTLEFLDSLDDNAIAAAISQAEKKTSGEIRLFVANEAPDDPVTEAKRQFLRLGMTRTKLRNAVLIYFAPRSRAFAIVGDEGIHKKCGDRLWTELTSRMTPLLKENHFNAAILLAIGELARALATEFPWVPGDRDELPNRVVRD